MLKNFYENHRVVFYALVGVLAIVIIFVFGKMRNGSEGAGEGSSEVVNSSSIGGVTSSTTVSGNVVRDEKDSELMRIQEALESKFGKTPEGYLWDSDGSLISLGDTSMTSEDVVYAYLNGIRMLDFSSAQKYARSSKVASRYKNYFDSYIPSSYDTFVRGIYRLALLSIDIKGIENIVYFADNMQVFTVNVEILDLSEKDFWRKDRELIYDTLYLYNTTEADSEKADQFLYNYIIEYYKSDSSPRRVISIDLPVRRYIELGTGWLISSDADIDSACTYLDGTTLLRYIKQMYAEEGYDYLEGKKATTEGSTEGYTEGYTEVESEAETETEVETEVGDVTEAEVVTEVETEAGTE